MDSNSSDIYAYFDERHDWQTPLAAEAEPTYRQQPNAEMRTAWRIIEHTSQNLFLTGKAGTGKTTILRTLRRHSSKRVVVLAPTGIAAINAGGMTIHSFFQLPLSPFVPNTILSESRRRFDRFSREKLRIIRTMDLLVIDEISMVRADLLDAVDDVLRRHRDPSRPFGGIQLLLIGDLQQLAPVIKPDEWELLRTHYSTPFFFSSKALEKTGYDTIELQRVYRQSDIRFLELLNQVRSGTADVGTLSALNSRHIPEFTPDPSEGYIRLTTHNRRANEINTAELDKIKSPAFTFKAHIDGDFPELSYPTDSRLTLKKGSQVMFLKNDPEKRFFNGMMGHIINISGSSVIVRPVGGDHNISVEPAIWENTRYALDKQSGAIAETVQGSFTQLPLRLAWAITIHKSQGLTFDKAIIDAADSFAHGQTYVALSRCRSLEGLVLDRPLGASAIINDMNVTAFTTTHCTTLPDNNYIETLINRYTIECLDEMFGMERLRMSFDRLQRVIDEFLSKDYPILATNYTITGTLIEETLEKVAIAFGKQYRQIPPASEMLRQRIEKGCRYFLEHLTPLTELIKKTPGTTDNKAVTTRLQAALSELGDILYIKRRLMNVFAGKPFTSAEFTKAKAQAILALESGTALSATERKPIKQKRMTGRKSEQDSDITDNNLYETLRQWRSSLAQQKGIPPFVILSNRAIIAIANTKPSTESELSLLPGIGKQKLRLYADQILQLVNKHR